MNESDQFSAISQNTVSSCDSTGTSSISSNATRSTAQDVRDTDVSDSSLLDMECNIQTERITKCLDKLVYQTKLAICIPILLRENVLADILPYGHLNQVEYMIDQYEESLHAISATNMAALEDLQAGDMSLKNRVNSDLSYLMHTLCSYPVLKPHVDRLTEQMKKVFTEREGNEKSSHVTMSKLTTPGLKHLLKVEEFRDLMVARMKTTAAEELAAIKNTRKLKKNNDECLIKIAEYEKRLKEEKRVHDKQLREKLETIEQMKQELKLNEKIAAVKRRKQILGSEQQMVLATRSHKVKVQMLKEEETDSREMYDNSVNCNMLAEKQLRDRRRKVETQLQSWVQKYDTEMQVKQGELDEITKDYDDEVQKCMDLKLKLAEQDKEFYPLMEEKEEEYHQEMTAKLNAFIIEHAARVIQYAWRTTLGNRYEKHKLLKLKKKMEMEREIAARKAEIEAKKQELLAKKAAKERAKAKVAGKATKSEAKDNKGKEEQDDSEG